MSINRSNSERTSAHSKEPREASFFSGQHKQPQEPSQLGQRLVSLDAFRGLTIACMLIVNNPGSWQHVYEPLLHAKWHGWTMTDWVFPSFLFIVGLSMTFSLQNKGIRFASQDLPQQSSALKNALSLAQQRAWFDLSKRALIIIAIGLALNFLPKMDISTWRFPGVLQRIGLCALIAAPMVIYLKPRLLISIALALLTLYSFIQLQVPVPDVSGIINKGLLEPGKDVGAFIDRALMSGHLWASAKTWDPEGLLSSLPALSSLLLGSVVGHALHASSNKTMTCLVFGLVSIFCIAVGLLLDQVNMPINKPLWTPAYVFLMHGWSLLIFTGLFWLMDVSSNAHRQSRWLFQPLVVFGMNALFIFALSSLVAKYTSLVKWGSPAIDLKTFIFQSVQALGISAKNSSLLHALAFMLVFLALARLMYSRRWFVKV
jgi:predicted acyltransferase